MLFTYFCFLLRLIYSALHRYMKLARYADELEAEKYIYEISSRNIIYYTEYIEVL